MQEHFGTEDILKPKKIKMSNTDKRVKIDVPNRILPCVLLLNFI